MKNSEITPQHLIQVTGMGMVSSLGFDVDTCCAAARAGLSRAQPLATFTVLTGDEVVDAGVTCHQVPFATQGFEGDTRLLRLTDLALQDLVNREPWLRGAKRCAAYLAMPGELPRSDADDTAGDDVDVPDAWQRARWLWARATAPLGLSQVLPLRHVSTAGHAAFARVLEQAALDLRSGLVDQAIVGGVDSLLDDDTLAWLEAAGRLKTPAVPAGLQPGEGAAFVVLELDSLTQARGGQAYAVLRALAFGQEPNLMDSDLPPSGRGFATALRAVLSRVHFKHLLPLWCVSDLTGEPYRAMDWACAELHVDAQDEVPVLGDTLLVAASFGDTRAASGALALCVAATAFWRRYAPSQVAALVSAADTGDRAVMLCQAV